MLLPLESYAFSATNYQVSDQGESCGRPNILFDTFTFRTSVVAASCAGSGSIKNSADLPVLVVDDEIYALKGYELQLIGEGRENIICCQSGEEEIGRASCRERV